MPTASEKGVPAETGFGATLKRTFTEFKEDNLTDWAAALTYYGVLALFPALIALVSIVGLVFDPRELTRALTDIVATVSPGTASETLSGPINSIANNEGTSAVMLVVGILGALWSASGFVGAFMRASNVMYEVDEGRPVYKLRPLQMLVTLVLVLLTALAALAVVVTGPLAEAVGDAVGLGSTAVTIWDIAKWPVLLAIVALMVSILFYASPNAKLRGGFRFVTPGGIVAVVVWLVASLLFAFYVANFGSYDKTYGTLGGVVSFLVWLWISNVSLLLGAQMNAERERSKELAEGKMEAKTEIQLPERDTPKPKQRPSTA
jgi:membrane protein